jgi:hypothetical protein
MKNINEQFDFRFLDTTASDVWYDIHICVIL